jgi:NADH-quinone oxidoreductase subunit L
MWFEPQFIGEGQAAFWQGAIFTGPDNHTLERIASLPFLVDMQPAIAGFLGFGLAVWFYLVNPGIPARLAEQFRPVYLFLLNKWYFDELYDMIFVKPAVWLAREFWQVGDVTIIDGVPNGLAALAEDGAKQAIRIQTGSIAVYAFTMLIGLVGLVSIFLIIH